MNQKEPRNNKDPQRARMDALISEISESLRDLAARLPKATQNLDEAELRRLAETLEPLRDMASPEALSGESFDPSLRRATFRDSRRIHSSHPWHGVEIGKSSPAVVTCYVEMVPTDTIKYEVDKSSGLLKADRPQVFSSVCPANYGFVPQTYCGDRVAELAKRKLGKRKLEGDGDPLDICVLSSHAIPHGDFLMEAVPIGGFRLIDRNQADDKIIAVMKGDPAYGHITDLKEVPKQIVEKLKHYFLTYKNMPDEERHTQLPNVYGRREAHDVIKRSQEDYRRKFGK